MQIFFRWKCYAALQQTNSWRIGLFLRIEKIHLNASLFLERFIFNFKFALWVPKAGNFRFWSFEVVGNLGIEYINFFALYDNAGLKMEKSALNNVCNCILSFIIKKFGNSDFSHDFSPKLHFYRILAGHCVTEV